MPNSIKRILIGKPLPTEHAQHERLTKLLALPIFASDALSSVAYATEEIMAALLLAGTAFFGLTPALSLAIVVLLGIVVISYRQTVMAYPNGGGAYIVARDNLGELPAQAAGAALLVDYVLTVAVSVSAGMAAINSLLKAYGHNIDDQMVPLCLLAIAVIALINLRGVRESGVFFAVPAYSFIVIMYAVIGIGLYKFFHHTLQPLHSAVEYQSATLAGEDTGKSVRETFGIFLLLHAFASGCTALTGVEAISNGVQAFKEPASRNAAITMTWLAGLLGTMFLGVSYLALHVRALPPDALLPGQQGTLGATVLSQVGLAVFGRGVPYLALQIVTCIILVLAANTSFAGFPRLCALQAADGFLPRQLTNTGDKLVFDNGIKILAVMSAILIVIFKGSVHYLIPLYAIGVFLSFTLSQIGMVKRWNRLRTPGWRMKAANNAIGAVCTFVVTIIFGVVKFSHGAWVVIILIPVLIALAFGINTHYRSVARQLSLQGFRPRQAWRHHVFVLASDMHRGVIPALQYARALASDAKALHVSIDPNRERRLLERWPLWSRGVPLQILPSPYRSLTDPIVDYIDHLRLQEPQSLITVIIPEFVSDIWWSKLLHGQAGILLSLRLRNKPGVVVTSVPYHIKALIDLDESDGTENPMLAVRKVQLKVTHHHEEVVEVAQSLNGRH